MLQNFEEILKKIYKNFLMWEKLFRISKNNFPQVLLGIFQIAWEKFSKISWRSTTEFLGEIIHFIKN